MYQVGDYVVYSNVIHKVLSVATAGYLGLQDARKTLPPRLVKHPDIHSIHKPIRPAILSDWAKEIPEKYREFYSVGAMQPVKYLIMYSKPDSHWIVMILFTLLETLSTDRQIEHLSCLEADGISTLLGIPIMPYELYQEYMKELSKEK